MTEKDLGLATFELNVKEGSIKLSGPVSFVEGQIDRIKTDNLMDNMVQYQILSDAQKPHSDGSAFPKFDNVLSIDAATGKVDILIPFNGKPKASATVDIVLIYIWAKRTIGQDNVPSKELRDVCQQHGVLDDANFAKVIGKQKAYFIVDKSAGFNVKLTLPGVKAAEKLLETLNQA